MIVSVLQRLIHGHESELASTTRAFDSHNMAPRFFRTQSTYLTDGKVRLERSSGKAMNASGHGRGNNSEHGELHGEQRV